MEKRERGEHRGETNHRRKRREMGDGRWETIEAEEKNGAKEKVGRCGRRGKGSGRTGKKKRAGSGMNVVGKSELEETK